MYNKRSSLPMLAGFLLSGLLFLMGALLNSCGRDSGSEPYAKDATGTIADFEGLDSSLVWGGGGMRISANPATLQANHTDQATVTVTLFDDSHNPMVNQLVKFAASHGIIGSEATTNEAGQAQVLLYSEPFEGDAWIGASVQIAADSVLRVARKVAITGLALQLYPQAADVLTGTNVPVELELLDASGNPISDQAIQVTGATQKTVTTNGLGKAWVDITSNSQQTLTLQATALGAKAIAAVNFWQGAIPEGTATNLGTRSIRLFSARSQLRADNSDFTEITAILVNEKRNPATGDTVYFQSSMGVVNAFGLVDSTGRAKATLRAAPANGICQIKALARGGTVVDSINVVFTGLNLTLNGPGSGVSAGTWVNVEAQLQDASNNAIGGDAIQFTLEGGTFENGTTLFTTNLDGNGKAIAQITSSNAGTVTVRATSQNSSDTLSVLFSRDLLKIQSSKTWLRVGGLDSTDITATYTNNSGTPLSGKTVKFYTSAGTIGATAVTSVLGVATVRLASSQFSGKATVQAVAENATASMEVEMRASTATSVRLTTTPDNIGVNGGVATLLAEVTDANGNTVTGEAVNFRILTGPGGGEQIGKVVVNSQSGMAQSTLQAGTRPSAYQGVLVEARLGSGVADTTKLTISGLPFTITVSRPQDDTVVVPNAGQMDQSVFDYFVGAVVQDVNGNPVADGTPVHFSAVVSGMAVYTRYLVEWEGVGGASDLKAKIGYRRLDIPFEDVNNNYGMDPEIDLTIDFNDNVARRGDDINGDGVVNYNPATHDLWYDFNGNGVCDAGVGEPQFDPVLYPSVYADLDGNGVWTSSELISDPNSNGCDLDLATQDFRYWLWEQMPMWKGAVFNFDRNDFAVVVAVSATTQGGVAQTAITYPRQMARRLFVTVNAEANGIKDYNGERFVLPVILGQ